MTSADHPESNGVNQPGIRPGRMLLLVFAFAGLAVLLIAFGALPPVFGFLAVELVLIVVFWQIRTHLTSILTVFVAVLLVSVIVTHRMPKFRPDRIKADEGDRLSKAWATSGRFNPKLPIVVHLIFDEMMSPGAMTADVPGGPAMRRSLEKFGQKHALRMYDSVYSRHFFSDQSIPSMMNSEYRNRTTIPEFLEDQKLRYRENPYFTDMARRGYRTAVFQSALMNFCTSTDVDLCETFDSFDPAGSGSVGLDARNQRVNLWQTVVRAYEPSYTSEVGQAILGRVYGLKTPEIGVLGIANRYDTQRFPAWFDRFTRFVAGVPRGTHIFAHFVVPHSPYLLTEGCVVSGKVEAGYYLANYPASERDEKRRHFYDGYLAQLGCVQRKLDDFMTTVSQSDNFKDAMIIIHGDHGSRISSGNTLEDYTVRDYIDNYATFFAVRSPAAKPGTDCEFMSLGEVFRRHVAPGAPTPPRAEPPVSVVAVSREAGKAPVEARMPMFGCAGAGTKAAAP